MKKKKKSWRSGPIIYRVKLNPEQAVLTCCDWVNKSADPGGTQCLVDCVPSGTGLSDRLS